MSKDLNHLSNSSNLSTEIFAFLNIPFNVPRLMILPACTGTGKVNFLPPTYFANCTWLPFRRVISKLSSCNAFTSSLPVILGSLGILHYQFYLSTLYFFEPEVLNSQLFYMEFGSFFKITDGIFYIISLSINIQFRAVYCIATFLLFYQFSSNNDTLHFSSLSI